MWLVGAIHGPVTQRVFTAFDTAVCVISQHEDKRELTFTFKYILDILDIIAL